MKPVMERLLSRIEIDDDGCWVWTGSTINSGYGQLRHRQVGSSLVHRIAYENLVGPVGPGLVLDHLCRVRRCCNPDHLEPVTQQQNLLRGVGTNAAKTHCNKGHEYSPDNTYVGKRPRTGAPYRICRTCCLTKSAMRTPRRAERAKDGAA